MDEDSRPDADDDRPPICPACGVTMGIVIDEKGATRYVCLECGFSDGVTVPIRRLTADERHRESDGQQSVVEES